MIMLKDKYDVTQTPDAIDHLTILLSICDFLYILNRDQASILLN